MFRPYFSDSFGDLQKYGANVEFTGKIDALEWVRVNVEALVDGEDITHIFFIDTEYMTMFNCSIERQVTYVVK